MRILTFVFILRSLAVATGASAGSAIFNTPLRCWDENEIVKLRARKLFEDVLPTPIPPEKINDKFIKDLVRYFRKTLRSVEMESDQRAELLKDAMADTLGAHLRNEILPAVRLAFYSGNISQKYAILIHELFEEMKEVLNTQGLGWQEPRRVQRWSNITVPKILISRTTSLIFDPCSNLVFKRDLNSCIHFPIPKLDDKENPSAIALPFKNGGLVSLTAPSSKNILLKYYTTAAKCIIASSPLACRELDIAGLNRDLWDWMKRDVTGHIQDEKLYTAFGGVLKVAAAVQAHRNSKTRRNLYEESNVASGAIIWHPFTQMQNMQMDVDWGPIVYILVVVAIAVAFFICQIIIHFLCTSSSNEVHHHNSYTTMNMRVGSFVSFLRQRLPTSLRTVLAPKDVSNVVNLGDQFSDEPKAISLGSIRTQKVYDLNENTEKLMAILSGNEMRSSTSDSEGDARKRSDSPPKLETSISEVKIDQQRKSAIGTVCSNSEHTEETYVINLKPAMCSTVRDYTEELEENPSDSLWTVSESESSRSESSTTSKYCSEKRKPSRLDQTLGSIPSVKLTSNTQINLNSFRAHSDIK